MLDTAFQDIFEKISVRKIQQTRGFCGEKTSQEYSLVDEAVKSTDLYKQKQDDSPRINYVAHQKCDGLIMSRMLADKFQEKEGYPTVVCNPEINSDDASSYIKEKELKRLATELGYAEEKKIPVFKTVGSVVTGVFGSIGSVATFLEAFDIKSFLGSKTILIAAFSIFMLAVFAGFIISAVAQKKRSNKEIISQAVKSIKELSDDDFESFLENLSEEDFSIEACRVSDDNMPVFICALQNYKYRQKCILMRYWLQLRGKQSWWIFAEDKKINEDFVLDSSEEVSCKYYTMLPLSRNEKLHIASVTYGPKVKFKPSEDSGVRSLGIDYICRFIMKKSDVQIDKAFLAESINEFVKEYSSYAVDIRLVIRLIAELECNYEIDFTNKRNWEHLFSYNNSIADLENLDISITKDLMLDNRAVKNLVPHIVDRFGEYFEEILAMNENNMLTTSQKQWCIVKLLKCKRNAGSLIALNDALMSEFAGVRADGELIDNMQTSEWALLTVKAMKRFYEAQEFWVLPLLINSMLYVFGREKNAGVANTLPERIFSLPEFLEVAKAVILLNISSDGGGLVDNCDILRDHYLVVKNAVLEREPRFNFENNTGCPQFFGLLKFSNAERQMYYNALRYLQENDVINYFELLYDMFCVSVSMIKDHNTRYCCGTIYKNMFYDKYIKKTGASSPGTRAYVRIILKKLLELLYGLYAERFEGLRSEISTLTDILDSTAGQPEEDIHVLLMYADIYDTESITFSACMVARACNISNISKDVYINLNNYLLALIFLLYHENSLLSYYNDDFVFLVKLLVAYTEPDEVLLGLVYFFNTIFVPKYSRQLISQYVANEEKKAAYIENLKNLAKSIQPDDFEKFISYLYVTNLSAEDLNDVMLILKSRIMNDITTLPNAETILECISLLCEGKSTEVFLNDSPENNLRKVNELLPDTVYIMYIKYFEIYEEDYSELCYIVAEKILDSNKVLRINPLFLYLFSAKNSESQEYIETEKLFFEYIEFCNLSFTIDSLERLRLFMWELVKKIKEKPEKYQWLKEARVLALKDKIDEKIAQKYVVETREYLSIRTWRKYGIVTYLRYLIRSTNDYRWEHFSDYEELGEEERFRYLVEHFSELKPYVQVNGYNRVNCIYLDLLAAFIDNKNNIQNMIDEKLSLKKFAQDARDVVDLVLPNNEKYKNDIKQIIAIYMSITDRAW